MEFLITSLLVLGISFAFFALKALVTFWQDVENRNLRFAFALGMPLIILGLVSVVLKYSTVFLLE